MVMELGLAMEMGMIKEFKHNFMNLLYMHQGYSPDLICGSGDGSGDGSGHGNGFGNGDGSGFGDGFGDGAGEEES